MLNLFKTKIGRLRIVSFLEGISLLLLLFIAMPLKYLANDPSLVKSVGLIHGILFILFVLNTMSAAIEHRWKFFSTTWKVLLSCIIPFGTFYVDKKILRQYQA
jgi:integral membrane protein